MPDTKRLIQRQKWFGVAAVLSLMLCGSVAVHAKTILPDSCGDDKVKFDVETKRDHPALGSPAEGKGQLVLIENNGQMVTPFSYATVRFGMDGAWVGANKGDSYFVMDVMPGEHHLCVSWQSAIGRVKKSIDVTSFHAEAGKVYYFAAQISLTSSGSVYVPAAPGPNGAPTGGGTVSDGPANIFFNLAQLNEDEGKYRVKAWKLSSWKLKS